MPAIKILVCGDVNGRFKYVFRKVEIHHSKKGPFEYLLCVGNFFGTDNDEWNDVVAGRIKVPVTTYILGPNEADHLEYYPADAGDELAPNIIYLGKRGLMTGSSGIKIAYLSGLESRISTGIHFSERDTSELVTSRSEIAVDIFLTSQWPRRVTNYADTSDSTGTPIPDDVGSQLISNAAALLKPRYHFAGLSDIHYERTPYKNHPPCHSTRFIGLASAGNEKKLKWIMAFNIIPLSSNDNKSIMDLCGYVTECPYNVKQSENQFFFDMDSSHGSQKRSKPEDGKSAVPGKMQCVSGPPDKCWFCLTNPDLQKHLLISLGEHAYIALAKGGMVFDHLLIIPMKHIRSVVDVSDEIEEEMDKYKKALVSFYFDNGKDVVFFERNYASQHLAIQVVPVPKAVTSKVKDAVFQTAALNELDFNELPQFSLLKQVVPQNKPYFHLEIVIDKKCEAKLIHTITGKFPLQFGRMVLASKEVLNKPESVDWKTCEEFQEDENEIVEQLREDFKSYDFNK